MRHLLCAIKGHRWKHSHGVYLDGKHFPSLHQKRCERCGDTKAVLFMGGA